MNKFLCRVLPVVLLSMVAAACATTEPPVATTTPANVGGVWSPSRADIAKFTADRYGIVRAEFKDDRVVIKWGDDQRFYTLVPTRIRTVNVGTGQWEGRLTLSDGTSVRVVLSCPRTSSIYAPTGGTYISCGVQVEGNQVKNHTVILHPPRPAQRRPAPLG